MGWNNRRPGMLWPVDMSPQVHPSSRKCAIHSDIFISKTSTYSCSPFNHKLSTINHPGLQGPQTHLFSMYFILMNSRHLFWSALSGSGWSRESQRAKYFSAALPLPPPRKGTVERWPAPTMEKDMTKIFPSKLWPKKMAIRHTTFYSNFVLFFNSKTQLCLSGHFSSCLFEKKQLKVSKMGGSVGISLSQKRWSTSVL